MNTGYVKARKTLESDEQYTPFYAVVPILKYLPKKAKIWLPFDKEWSAFNVALKENGYETIYSHIENGKDFFEYDVIVSNPPFSIKNKVLDRVYDLGKPFFLLMPLPALQCKGRQKQFEKGLQILCFERRIDFHNFNNMKTTVKGTPFASVYFVGGGLLDKDLVIEDLLKFERPLIKK